MREKIKSSLDWTGEFDAVFRHLTDARNFIKDRDPAASSDVLGKIYYELEEIEKICKNLKHYFSINSIEKFVTGQKLSREEFYLLVAQKIWTIDELHDPYEEFTYYHYEDNKRIGYISSSAIFGITPEDVKTSFLNPEQKEFFREHIPDLFARFKKD